MITSFPGVPIRMSSPGVPTMVAGRPMHISGSFAPVSGTGDPDSHSDRVSPATHVSSSLPPFSRSVPLSPESMSLPAPPRMSSFSDPPHSRSSPLPPYIRSSSWSPSTMSFPGPPPSRSSPFHAWRTSSPTPPTSTSSPGPLDSTSLPASPYRWSIPWSPPPPVSVSSSAPPRSWSFPYSPNRPSSPGPPRITSSPCDPNRESLPGPPQTRSLPWRPLMTSSPPSPWITSAACVPMMKSSSGVPTIVAATPSQLGPVGGGVTETSEADGGAVVPLLGVIGPSPEHAWNTRASAPNTTSAEARRRTRPPIDVRALAPAIGVRPDNDIRPRMATHGSAESRPLLRPWGSGSPGRRLQLPPELPPVHLPHGRQRQLWDEPDLLGPLRLRQPFGRERKKVLLARLGALAPDHERHDLLAVQLVGPADHPGHGHRGVLGQGLLHVPGVDVDPSPDHQVLLAFHHEQEPLAVDPTDVAGVEPSALHDVGGLLGLPPVPPHDVRPPHADLAGLAGRDLQALVVLDAELDARQRPAHGARPPRPRRGVRGHGGHGLRAPVPLEHHGARSPLPLPGHLQRQGGRSGDDVAERGQVVVLQGDLEQVLEHRGNHRHARHAMLLDGPQERERFEPPVQDPPALHEQPHGGHQDPVGVGERQGGHGHLVLTHLAGLRGGSGVERDVAVREHHALRRARGPAGEQQRGEVVLRLWHRVVQRLVVHEIVERHQAVLARAGRDHRERSRGAFQRLADHRQELRAGHHHRWLGLLDHARHLVGREQEQHRRDRGSRPPRPAVHRPHLRPVRQHGQDPVARPPPRRH